MADDLQEGAPHDDGRRVQAAAAAVERAGHLLPFRPSDAPLLRRFQDMDLCAMIEGVFQEVEDPLTLDPEGRGRLLGRLGDSYRTPSLRGDHRTRYFLVEGGAPVGTLSLDQRSSGLGLVGVSALYLLPGHRRRGVAERALRALQGALVRQGLSGVWLDTYWVWQAAVRYYLRRGFWLLHWKHDLSLMWHRGLPPYRVEIDGDRAQFLIQEEGGWRWLHRAQRRGERLVLERSTLCQEEGHARLAAVHGEATLALALAVAGWPLLRSPEALAAHRHREVGPPEALACRVEWWEALARGCGWTVETPRLPGLRYRSEEELSQEAS